jgi:branched-chain amino acid transport system substrate-binding protein
MVAALLLAVVVGWSSRSTVTPLPQSFCSPVDYGRIGSPRFLIVSDFPFQGVRRTNSEQFDAAIRFILARDHFKAGKYSIGYQACDDSNPETGFGDPTLCAANAKAYAADLDVIGVIGTWNSRCAGIEIPVLNGAPRGPLALVSPSNTAPGLTHAAAGTDPDEPGRYYPTGRRSFVRLIPSDDFQGAGDAVLASKLRLKRVVVFDNQESYGLNIAGGFKSAARHLHLRVVGTAHWDPGATQFQAVAQAVQRAHADGVFLSGAASPSTGELLRELRSVLGSKGVILAPDGFSPLSNLIATFGPSATEGMYVSEPGFVRPKLGALARLIFKRFGGGRPGSGGPLDAAEAAEVLIAAIANSDGSRASTTRHLFQLRIVNGILGNFRFDRSGDITLDPITVFRARHGRAIFDREIAVPHDLNR